MQKRSGQVDEAPKQRSTSSHPATKSKFSRYLKTLLVAPLAALSIAAADPVTTVDNKAQPAPATMVTESKSPAVEKEGYKFYNDFSTNVSVFANEAGSSVLAELIFHRDFTLNDKKTKFHLFTSGGGGAIWIGPALSPVGQINLAPRFDFLNKDLSLGTVNNFTFTNINSWFYTANSLYLSGGHDFGKVGFKLASMLQFGVSLPIFDDLFVRWYNAASLSFMYRYQFYAIQTSYFAASKTPLTTWALDYMPRYQSIEVGFNAEILPNRGIITAGAIFDKMDNSVFARYSQFVYRKGVDVKATVEAGLRGIETDFFPLSFHVLVGLEVGMGSTQRREGRKIEYENRYSVEYQNNNLGLAPEFTTVVIGNNQYPNQQAEQWIKSTRNNLDSSSSFQDFVGKYKGASKDEILAAASYIGSVLGDVGYAYDMYFDLQQFNFLSPRVKTITHQTYDDILNYTRQYVDYYQAHGNYDNLPEDLKAGVTICAGISEFMAEFLRRNGINAYAVTVNTREAQHVVAAAFYDGKATILDYGSQYTMVSGSFDEVLNTYARIKNAPIFETQVFGAGGQYFSTHVTPTGDLFQKTRDIDGRDIILDLIESKDRK